MEVKDIIKKLEIIIDEVDKEIYEKGADQINIPEMTSIDAEVLLDSTWLQGYLKCAKDLKAEIEEELKND